VDGGGRLWCCVRQFVTISDMKRELAEVRRARMAVQAAQVRLEAAVRAASAAGGSLREIGREAGVSYEQVRRLLSR
jgi:hypothetical protein